MDDFIPAATGLVSHYFAPDAAVPIETWVALPVVGYLRDREGNLRAAVLRHGWVAGFHDGEVIDIGLAPVGVFPAGVTPSCDDVRTALRHHEARARRQALIDNEEGPTA